MIASFSVGQHVDIYTHGRYEAKCPGCNHWGYVGKEALQINEQTQQSPWIVCECASRGAACACVAVYQLKRGGTSGRMQVAGIDGVAMEKLQHLKDSAPHGETQTLSPSPEEETPPPASEEYTYTTKAGKVLTGLQAKAAIARQARGGYKTKWER